MFLEGNIGWSTSSHLGQWYMLTSSNDFLTLGIF